MYESPLKLKKERKKKTRKKKKKYTKNMQFKKEYQ